MSARPLLQKITVFVIAILSFATVFLLLFSRGMTNYLDHDEHQFIASGKLFSDKMLLPYKDYPYFHMPNMIFIYALTFTCTSYLLFWARTLSTIFELSSLLLVFYIAIDLFRGYHVFFQLSISIGSVIFLLMNQFFIAASGLAWNHALPVFSTLIAFTLHCYGARREKPDRWVFLSGVFLGFAIGTRLSFAPTIIPFIGTMFMYKGIEARRKKIYLPLLLCFGICIPMIPSILMFILYPERFIFGNIGYARLNTIYRLRTGYNIAMTMTGKFLYLKDKIRLPDLLMIFLFLSFLSVIHMTDFKTKKRDYFEIIFIMVLVPSILVGSFAPTPSFKQYFYAPIPFILLGILYEVAIFFRQPKMRTVTTSIFLLAVAIVIAQGYSNYRHVVSILSPQEWTPVKVHEMGLDIAAATDGGRVLTLAPIFPLEGKLGIYKEFTTGPFSWRTAPLLPENKRREFEMLSESDLKEFLRVEPPSAILVGFESDLETSLISYARENGYQRLTFTAGKSNKLTESSISLWLLPSARSENHSDDAQSP